jgi:hypothetical protein
MSNAPRKTFDVDSFKNYVNEQLKRNDGFATEDFKAGLCTALEHVLHNANTYQGYNDLYWLEQGASDWVVDGKTEIWEEKKLYIYGPAESKYHGSLYSRFYY